MILNNLHRCKPAFQAEAPIVADRQLVPLPNEHIGGVVCLTANYYGELGINRGETVAMTNLGPSGPFTCINPSGVASQGSFDSDDNDFSDTEFNTDRRPPPRSVSVKSSLPVGIGAVGTVFRLLFLGSVEVDEEGGRKRRKRLKNQMVEEAVNKVKVCVRKSQ